jgi:hypothetical protein
VTAKEKSAETVSPAKARTPIIRDVSHYATIACSMKTVQKTPEIRGLSDHSTGCLIKLSGCFSPYIH